MTTLENILVATDFEDPANAALTYGRALADAFHATLHILHVTDDVRFTAAGAELYGTLDADVQADVDEAARVQLASLVVDRDSDCPTNMVVRASHAPALAIVEYARTHDINLIVMGTHGRRALAHVLMGSVAERVVRTAPCPVLTIHHPEHEFVLPDVLAVEKATA